MSQQHTAGAYYGGVGSMLLGARWAGFRPEWIYEPRDFFNKETFHENFPHAVDMYNLPDEIGYEPEPVTVMMGSPDCKKFSNLGTKRKDREGGKLKNLSLEEVEELQYVKFLRIVNNIQPDTFILENVPNILKNLWFGKNIETEFGETLYTSLTGISSGSVVLTMRGYKIQTITLDAFDFGVPQHRKRVFVIGAKNFQPEFNLEKWALDKDAQQLYKTHRVGRTVKEAFFGLGKDSLNHVMPNHSDERIEGFHQLKPGSSYYGGQNNKRLIIDMPAGTVTSHCSRFVHPTAPRVLTVRETARLMGFPDDFKFYGTEGQQLDQVGKSVVPQVAAALCLYIREQLKII